MEIMKSKITNFIHKYVYYFKYAKCCFALFLYALHSGCNGIKLDFIKLSSYRESIKFCKNIVIYKS